MTALDRMRAKLPRMALGGVDVDKIVQMLATPYDNAREELRIIREALAGDSSEAPRWLLELRAKWIGMRRPAGWSDKEFDFWVKVRSASNRARGTRPGILAVAEVIAGTRGSRVFGSPKSVIVQLVAFPDLSEYPHAIDIAKEELLRAVSETTELVIILGALGLAFTWDTENLGWDQGIWIDPL